MSLQRSRAKQFKNGQKRNEFLEHLSKNQTNDDASRKIIDSTLFTQKPALRAGFCFVIFDCYTDTRQCSLRNHPMIKFLLAATITACIPTSTGPQLVTTYEIFDITYEPASMGHKTTILYTEYGALPVGTNVGHNGRTKITLKCFDSATTCHVYVSFVDSTELVTGEHVTLSDLGLTRRDLKIKRVIPP